MRNTLRMADVMMVESFEARLPELGYLSAVLATEPEEDGRGSAVKARTGGGRGGGRGGGGLEGQSQALPRHLRRRTTSHKPRRMSVALKNRRNGDRPTTAAGEAARPSSGAGPAAGQGNGESASAMRCRKHRRRPRVLLEARSPHVEVLPAGAPARWLETHIWHAKRMHMAERWGFVLPVRSNRGPRAVVEAALKHCTLQDVTFLRPLEIRGPQGFLLELLAAVTDPLDEKTRAPACVEGFVEASTTLYRANEFPCGCVSPVTVMWSPPGGGGSLQGKSGGGDATDSGRASPGSATRDHPREDVLVVPPARDLGFDEAGGVDAEASRGSGSGAGKLGVEQSRERVRRVWVWVHVAAAEEALKEIRKACLLEGAPWHGHLEVGPVKGGLARLRVRGRRAHEAMQKVVKVTGLETEGARAVADIGLPEHTGGSLDSAVGESNHRWTSMGPGSGVAVGSVPGDLPNGSIMALTALDPRDLPREFGIEDEAVGDDTGGGGGGTTSPSNAHVLDTSALPAPVSALWNPDARAASAELARVRPDHVVNERRRQERGRSGWDSIPEVTRTMAEKGTPIRWSKPRGARATTDDTIPVLIINASGEVPSTHTRGRSAAAGVGCAPADREFERKRRVVAGGWDLILSAGWAPVFFNALYMAGARAISLGDADVVALETDTLRFPTDFPDTLTGRDYWRAWGAEREAAWNRTRPKHRGFKPPKHLAAAANRADDGRERSTGDAKPGDGIAAVPVFQPDLFFLAGGSRVTGAISTPVAAETGVARSESSSDPREGSLPGAAGRVGDRGEVSVEREPEKDVRESRGGAAEESEGLSANKEWDGRQSDHAPAHAEDKEIPANQDVGGGPVGDDPAHEGEDIRTNRDGDGYRPYSGLAEGVENLPGKGGGDGRQSDGSPLPEGAEVPATKGGDGYAADDAVPNEGEDVASKAGGDDPHPCVASPREGIDLSVDEGGDGARERDDVDGEEIGDAPHEQPVDELKARTASPMEEDAPLQTSGDRERNKQGSQRPGDTDAGDLFALARGFHYTKAFLPGEDVLPARSSSAAPQISLSIPTMLQVTEGALVHAAAEEHVVAWERSKQDGHPAWAGLPVTSTLAREGSSCSSTNGLRAIGMVTTGGFSFLRGRGAGLAVCEALAVRDALMMSAVVGRGSRAIGDEGKASGVGKRKKKSSRRSSPTGLVLVRSSLGGDKGNWFRPATITLVE